MMGQPPKSKGTFILCRLLIHCRPAYNHFPKTGLFYSQVSWPKTRCIIFSFIRESSQSALLPKSFCRYNCIIHSQIQSRTISQWSLLLFCLFFIGGNMKSQNKFHNRRPNSQSSSWLCHLAQGFMTLGKALDVCKTQPQFYYFRNEDNNSFPLCIID